MFASRCASLEEVGSLEYNLGGPLFLPRRGLNLIGLAYQIQVLSNPEAAKMLALEDFHEMEPGGNA